jgi:hypothetical protein
MTTAIIGKSVKIQPDFADKNPVGDPSVLGRDDLGFRSKAKNTRAMLPLSIIMPRNKDWRHKWLYKND